MILELQAGFSDGLEEFEPPVKPKGDDYFVFR
jgi:hypothetical protein